MWYAILIIVFAASVAACQRAPEPVAVDSAADVKVLQTFPADRVSFQLSLGPCDKTECRLAVQLLEAGRVLHTHALPVAASTRPARSEAVNGLWGADAGLQAWAIGEEQNYVATVARLVKLGSRGIGLLVTQRYGFDHLKRSHLLLAPEGQRLARLWGAEEGSGPTWSSTQVLPVPPGNQPIVYWRGFFPGSDRESDRIDAEEVRWDDSSKALRVSPLPDDASPLLLTVVGEYSSVASARRARAAKGECLADFAILSSAAYLNRPGRRVVIGAVSATREAAQAFQSAAIRCVPASRVSIVAHRPRR